MDQTIPLFQNKTVDLRKVPFKTKPMRRTLPLSSPKKSETLIHPINQIDPQSLKTPASSNQSLIFSQHSRTTTKTKTAAAHSSQRKAKAPR
jgi:hypothetical protein